MSWAHATPGRRHLWTEPVRDYGLQVVVLVAAWIYFATTVDGFGGEKTITAVAAQFPDLGLVALGAGIAIIAGELDMSLGSVAAAAGMLSISVASAGFVVALAVGVGFGLVLGALQGFIIARTEINSVVFTVGTLIGVQGFAELLGHDGPLTAANVTIGAPLTQSVGIVNVGSITAFVIFVALGAGLTWVKYGRDIYAIGGGRGEARAAGVAVQRALIIVFLVSGALGALAGTITSLEYGAADPSSFGTILLSGVAAALVGGVSLNGGRGNVLNVALGVAIVAVITTGLTIQTVSDSMTQLIIAAVLFGTVVLDALIRRALSARRQTGEATALPGVTPGG